MTPSHWAGLGEAVEKAASDMTPRSVAGTLKALCTLEAAAAAVSPSGWAALAEAVELTAHEMNPQEASTTLYALGVLPADASELSLSAWTQLEAAAEREAPSMTSYEREATLRCSEQLNAGPLAPPPPSAAKMTVARLRSALMARGMKCKTKEHKSVLRSRLQAAMVGRCRLTLSTHLKSDYRMHRRRWSGAR